MRVIVVTERPDTCDGLRQAVLGAGLECRAADCVSHRDLPFRLAKHPADLVVVDAGAGPEGAEAAVEYAATRTGLPVFAVGPTDPARADRLARHGARAYLDADRFGAELVAAAAAFRRAGPAATRGRTVAVLAAVPGAGATTVAANLAVALAAGRRGRVALAEFGGSPALALALDLRPRHTVADLAAEAARVDADMARGAAVEHPAGVAVLAHAPDAFRPPSVGADAAGRIAIALRAGFDLSVLDLGADGPGGDALALADVVLVVTRPDVPAVRRARLLLDRLAADGTPDAAVRVVVNRYGQRGQLPWRRVEEGLGRPAAAWLPDAPGPVTAALNLGRPVVETARWAGIARRVRRLAAAVAPTEVVQ